MHLETELVSVPGFARAYLVRINSRPVGLLTKRRGMRGDIMPWQAFVRDPAEPVGFQQLLGSYFQEDGGKSAAMEAIIQHALKEAQEGSARRPDEKAAHKPQSDGPARWSGILRAN